MSRQKTPEPPSWRADASEEGPASEPLQRLTFDVIEDGGDWSHLVDPQALAAEVACLLIVDGAVDDWLPAMASIALSDDASVQRLNRTYRMKDAPTNVLSFPSASGGNPHLGYHILGDIVLADGVVVREAAELGIPLAHHVQHLILHGALHLMGHDHETEHEAAVMERLETALLARIGIADPHAPID